MKVKAIRKTTGDKEFIYILNTSLNNHLKCTCEIPQLFPMTSNMEGIQLLNSDIDFSDCEMVVLDVLDSNEIGADIRNKLSPIKTLLSLLKLVDDSKLDKTKKKDIKSIIKKEIEKSEKIVDYLANLL